MDAEQSAELTGTNRPCGLTISLRQTSKVVCGIRMTSPCTLSVRFVRKNEPRTVLIHKFPVVISRRPHPIPSRTRKLSSSEPMVLHGKPCGRVGRCRDFFKARPEQGGLSFLSLLVPLGRLQRLCSSAASTYADGREEAGALGFPTSCELARVSPSPAMAAGRLPGDHPGGWARFCPLRPPSARR